MSRYYKTARANFVDDKMFTLPAELMYKTIADTDKNIDDEFAKIDAFNNLLKTENLKVDDPAVNERLKDYQSKIGGISDTIYKSPLDYKKQRGHIASLSRELDNELSRGLLGKAQAQLTDYNAEMKRVEEMKDVTGEQKDLYKRALMEKYKRQGGLAWKDENTYNQISQLFETPLEHIDSEKMLNTVATNYTPDQKAKAWAYADNKGYLHSGNVTTEEREAIAAGEYVRQAIQENGWLDEQRQILTWKKELGELGEGETVESKLKEIENAMVERAKEKLGYEKVTKDASISADSAYLTKLRMQKEDEQAGVGHILTETIDPRSADFSDYKVKDIEKNAPRVNKLILDSGNETLDGLVKALYNKEGNKLNFKDFDNQLAAQGMSRQDFVDYVNYQNGIVKLETPHQPDYNPNDVVSVTQQKNNLKRLVTSWNNMNPNEQVKNVKVAYSDGSYHYLEHNTLGGLIEDPRGFVYIPATGTSQKQFLKTNNNGDLLDSDGQVITDDDGKTVKTIEEAIAAERGELVAYDPQKVATYDMGQVPFQATTGNFRQSTYKQYDAQGRVNEGLDYTVSNPYYSVDTKTGKRTLVNLMVTVPSKRLDNE